MKTKLTLTALLAAVALTPVAAAPAGAQTSSGTATGVLPGYWEYRARVAIFPVSTEHHCLKADEIERFLFHPCTRRYTCTYPVKQVGDGKVNLDGTWTDKKNRQAKVRANGTYTPTSMNLKANVVTINGIPVSGTITARRVSGTCPSA